MSASAQARNVAYVLLAAIFSQAMIAVDWPGLFLDVNGFPMVDRDVYLGQIFDSNLPTDYLIYDSPIDYVTNEYLWSSSLAYLTRDMAIPPERVFYFISTACLFMFALVTLLRAGPVYALLLINPLVVDFAFSQLRLALAISILLLALLLRRMPPLALAIAALSLLIHTASIIFIALYLLAEWLPPVDRNKRFAISTPAILLAAGAAIAVATGPAREMILSAVGDRRVEYPNMSSSLFYLSFWVFNWGLFLTSIKRFFASTDQRFAFAVLSIVAFNLLFAGYSTRFIAAIFPFLIISASRFTGWQSLAIKAAFPLYSLIQWLFWIRVF